MALQKEGYYETNKKEDMTGKYESLEEFVDSIISL